MLAELVEKSADTTFIAVRDGKGMEATRTEDVNNDELVELMKQLPRDQVAWYSVIPDQNSGVTDKRSQPVNLREKVRNARAKIQGLVALGIQSKTWNLAEQRAAMDSISESRCCTKFQSPCSLRSAASLQCLLAIGG